MWRVACSWEARGPETPGTRVLAGCDCDQDWEAGLEPPALWADAWMAWTSELLLVLSLCAQIHSHTVHTHTGIQAHTTPAHTRVQHYTHKIHVHALHTPTHRHTVIHACTHTYYTTQTLTCTHYTHSSLHTHTRPHFFKKQSSDAVITKVSCQCWAAGVLMLLFLFEFVKINNICRCTPRAMWLRAVAWGQVPGRAPVR